MSENTNERPEDRTAQHGGEGGADRDSARPEPGSGLERRQDRNSASTDQSQSDSSGGVKPESLDPKNR